MPALGPSSSSSNSFSMLLWWYFCFFHRSLSDSKSPQASRTLLSILSNHNYSVVWVVSILLISNFFNVSKDRSKRTFMFHIFLIFWQNSNICLSFRFLLFSLYGPPERQNPQDGKFPLPIFLFLFLCNRSVCTYLKIPDNFMRLIFLDWFLFVHLLVWSNFNLSRNNHWITYLTESCLVLNTFCACLQHSLIKRLSVSSVLLLHLIEFHFNVIGPNGVDLCFYCKRFSFSL